jgi:mycoredoxin
MNEKIKVYGADWCGMTTRSLALLDRFNVDYEYVNIETAGNEEAAAWVRDQNDGKERKPTIKIANQVIVEPSDSELEQVLQSNNLIG